MASPGTQQGSLSVDTGTCSQESLQGWTERLGCTVAPLSPRAGRLSRQGARPAGSVAANVACPGHEPFPPTGMGATGLSSAPAKR